MTDSERPEMIALTGMSPQAREDWLTQIYQIQATFEARRRERLRQLPWRLTKAMIIGFLIGNVCSWVLTREISAPPWRVIAIEVLFMTVFYLWTRWLCRR